MNYLNNNSFQIPETIHQVLKIVFIGDSNVGKTSLLRRFQHNSFTKNHNRSTIGVEFCKKMLRFPEENLCIQLHLWDTAGQERYKSITKQHYRGAAGIILIFDLLNPKTLDSISNWLEEIKENSSNDCFLALIGNKKDASSNKNSEISNISAKNFAEANKLFYYETSAIWDKEAENGIETIMLDFVYEILKNLKENGVNCDETVEEKNDYQKDEKNYRGNSKENSKENSMENSKGNSKENSREKTKKSLIERRISFESVRISQEKGFCGKKYDNCSC